MASNAADAMANVFVNASDVQLAHQLGKARDEVLEMVAFAVARARNVTDDVEFSPMDATRADPDFLAEIVREALQRYFAVREYRALRAELTIEAEAQGIVTDEDVFDRVS